MTADHAAADERALEHLPRLPDAGDAPRDTAVLPDPGARVSAAEDDLDLAAPEVTGHSRRLPGRVDVADPDPDDLEPDDVPYFRYDPDTGETTTDPPPGTRLEGGCLVVDL